MGAYRELAPSPALRRYVDTIWTLRGLDAGDNRVLPDGCIDVIFDLGAGTARFVGTMTRPVIVPIGARTDVLGVRFRPAAVRPFFGPAADEITDAWSPLELEWRNAGELLDRLTTARSEDRTAIVEHTLREKLARATRDVDVIVEACAGRIQERGGQVLMRELEHLSGYSERQLERRFAAEIGVSPKRFARVARMQRALARAPHVERGGWARAALDLGFSDQAHLVRELRALTGATPSQLASR